jgi:nucleoside-diphosphate-sugar epimerase
MIEESARAKPFTVWVRPGTRAPVLYYKDAARAMLSLADAPRDAIRTVNYVVDGVRPRPSAEELAGVVRAAVPAARITFEPDEELQAILDRTLLPIDDSRAREEWGWQVEYGLEEMVRDFVREVAENPQRYP